MSAVKFDEEEKKISENEKQIYENFGNSLENFKMFPENSESQEFHFINDSLSNIFSFSGSENDESLNMQEEEVTVEEPFNLKDELKQLEAEKENSQKNKRKIRKIVGIRKRLKSNNFHPIRGLSKPSGNFPSEEETCAVNSSSLRRRMKKDQLRLTRCLLDSKKSRKRIRRI